MTVVVKLGGSLAKAHTLKGWLKVVARHGAGRAVLVPGGGVFADTVRAAQRDLEFSDVAAHRMAVLAMEQYALLMADFEPSFRLCATEREMDAALTERHVALWRPYAMVAAAAEVAASWDLTSDSLAAWLARKIGAARLVLVKSARSEGPVDPERLAAHGLVDSAFPAFAIGAGFALGYCGPGEETRLAEALGADAP